MSMIYSEVLSQKYSRILQIVKYELNKRDQKDRVLVDHDTWYTIRIEYIPNKHSLTRTHLLIVWVSEWVVECARMYVCTRVYLCVCRDAIDLYRK